MTGEVLIPARLEPSYAIEQLTVLAEAFGAPLTAERLKIYAEALCDLDRKRFTQAVGRAVRECRFFPSVAELRELASAKDEQSRLQLEARQAWARVEQDLRVFGLQRCPGRDERFEYAVRCAGGRRAINDSYRSPEVADQVFCEKRFIDGFLTFNAAKALDLHELPAPARDLLKQLGSGNADALTLPASPQAGKVMFQRRPAAVIPRPITDAEIQARRDLLAEQAVEAMRKYGTGEATNR